MRAAVLRNPELVTRILREFDPWDLKTRPEDEKKKRKRQLRNLALVCKGFRAPALDILWACVESLYQLVTLLPGIQHGYNGDPLYMYHSSSISKTSSFRRYASRVRRLDLKPPKFGKGMAPHLWVLIGGDLQGRLLFPNVKILSMEISTGTEAKEVFAVLPLLFTPVITTVNFSGHGLTCGLFANYCLPLLAHRCPSLEDLTFQAVGQYTGLNAVGGMRNLKSLNLGWMRENSGLKSQFLVDILRPLKNLTTLTLDVHFKSHRDISDLYTCSPGVLGLSHIKLETLSVTSRATDGVDTDSLCACVPLFLLRTTSTMVNLTLHDTRVVHPCFFDSLVKVLSQNSGLKKLRIMGTGTSLVTNLKALQRLTQVSVKELELDIRLVDPTARDYSLTQFIKTETVTTRAGRVSANPSIPHPLTLRTLSIPVSEAPEQSDVKGATWGCLKCVAFDGPALEHLTVGLDATFATNIPDQNAKMVDWLTTLQKGPKSTSKLKSLSIFDPKDSIAGMTMQEGNVLAQVLDFLFPSLETISPYCKDHMDRPYWKDHWALLEALRKMCQIRRRGV